MVSPQSTLPTPQPESDIPEHPDFTLILSPEEPELQYYLKGEFLKFTNGRLAIPDDNPAAEQLIENFRNQPKRCSRAG